LPELRHRDIAVAQFSRQWPAPERHSATAFPEVKIIYSARLAFPSPG
jgi:hypothetical protein